MTILKEDTGYSAIGKVNDAFIATQGDTFDELKDMILDAVNLAFEDVGSTYSIKEIHFKYDLESFFDFYKVINAKALRKNRDEPKPFGTIYQWNQKTIAESNQKNS